MKRIYHLHSLLLILALWGCGDKRKAQTAANEPIADSAQTDASVVPVRLATVQQVSRAELVVASGLVSSSEEARLSFKVGGIINKLYVGEGQTVRKGQLLATLNLTEINAQVAQAELAHEKAGRDLGRVIKLYADTAATLEQLQNATTGNSAAKQNLTIANLTGVMPRFGLRLTAR